MIFGKDSYAWLVAGVVLLGLSILIPSVPQSAAIHALTAGAMGTMILAVMTRATRGHTGRELSVDRMTALIYLLVTLAAMTRVAAAFVAQVYVPLLILSAVFWIAAFGAFIISYGRCWWDRGITLERSEARRIWKTVAHERFSTNRGL